MFFFHGFYNHSLELRRISFVWYSFWHSKTPHLLDSISYCLTSGVLFNDLTPRGFSIVRFVLQHLLGERPIEELDEGPKAERTDQGAKAHKATQQPAQQGAERIGEDAAPEVRAGCVVPQTEGKVIVGRDAEVGGLVERSAQRRDQHRRP